MQEYKLEKAIRYNHDKLHYYFDHSTLGVNNFNNHR